VRRTSISRMKNAWFLAWKTHDFSHERRHSQSWMTVVIFTMFSRFECEHATFSLSQMTESKDSQSKKIRRIKRAIHSKEEFNKKMSFKIQWVHCLITETVVSKKENHVTSSSRVRVRHI
jgi:hypothetical protein